MTSQELFDKWYSEKRLNITYSAALQIWNASRASIEITMPPRIANINLRTPLEVEDMWKHRLIYAAKEAGITVKGE